MRSSFLLAALCLTAFPISVHAQGFGKKAQDNQNLGVLGAGVEVQGATIHVREVHKGGPAESVGIQVGDQIVKVGGRALQPSQGLQPGPIAQVIAEVEKAEAARKRTPVVLTISRGGTEKEFSLPVQKLGAHSKSCPNKCKKCSRIVQQGLEFLARTQGGNGEFSTDLGGKTGKVVVTSLGGLAFLAAGASPARGSPLDRAGTYVLNHANKAEASPFGNMGGRGGGNWNQVNWELAYSLVFLAEMARKTKRPDYKAKCAELVKALNNTLEQSGGWAHGPGGPNALGYVELEIVSNYALLGMGAAKKLGLELDDAKVNKALAWIEATTNGNGGVGYSPRSGQKGHGDPGRTAGALVAFKALGASKLPFYAKMAGFYQTNMGKLTEGHVSPAMHLLAGAMGAKVIGKKAWKNYMNTYRLHIMGARKPDGSFASTPTKESQSMRNNTDLTVGPRWVTATYVIILSLDNEKIPYLMGGKGEGGGRKKLKIKARPRTGDGARPETGG